MTGAVALKIRQPERTRIPSQHELGLWWMEIIFKSISIKSGLKPELFEALRLVKIVNLAFIIEFIFKRRPKNIVVKLLSCFFITVCDPLIGINCYIYKWWWASIHSHSQFKMWKNSFSLVLISLQCMSDSLWRSDVKRRYSVDSHYLSFHKKNNWPLHIFVTYFF